MTYSNPRDLSKYRQFDSKVEVLDASPHRLVQMLLEGALEKISIAKGHMERGNVAEKGRHVSWAISIIDGLRLSIDKDNGGEIATNLDDLYDYINRRLLQSNVENDISILDEVSSLLREIKSAWDVIPDDLKGTRAKLAGAVGGDDDTPPTQSRISVGV